MKSRPGRYLPQTSQDHGQIRPQQCKVSDMLEVDMRQKYKPSESRVTRKRSSVIIKAIRGSLEVRSVGIFDSCKGEKSFHDKLLSGVPLGADGRIYHQCRV